MKKKKNIFLLIFIVLIVLIILIFGIILLNKNKNFLELSYEEILEKIDNKDSFILCVSRKNCSHCQDYKPKLNDISKKYDVKVYYIDIDSFSKKRNKEFSNKFSFDGATPTTIFFTDGVEKTTGSRIEGDASKEKIVDKFKKNGFIK